MSEPLGYLVGNNLRLKTDANGCLIVDAIDPNGHETQLLHMPRGFIGAFLQAVQNVHVDSQMIEEAHAEPAPKEEPTKN
jgi:hypothetical protein